MGKINVNGTATRAVEFDKEIFNLHFRSTSEKLGEAVDKSIQQTELFLEQLFKNGFKQDQVKFINDYLVNDFYYNDKMCCQATRNISLTTIASPKVHNLILEIIKENNLEVDFNSECVVSNADEINKQLRLEAIKNSQSEAENIAKAFGQSVVSILEINPVNMYGCVEEMDYEVPALARKENLLSDNLKMNTTTLTQEVMVSWEIK